jgi:hypothetical protein
MRRSAARATLPALALLALVGVVTVAAGGSTGTRSGETQTPAGVLFDTIFSLVLVGMLASAALLVYALAHRGSRGYPRTSGHLASLAMLAALAFLLANLHASGSILSQSDEGEQAPVIGGATNTSKNRAEQRSAPEFPWLPVTVTFALTATGVAAMLLAERRRRPREDAPETVGGTVVGVLEDTLDDLYAEADPRRAVIAAYARLERALAAQGLPRHAPETHEEYLARILGQLDVGTRSIRRLTDLFMQAKFSQHAVDIAMREEAIVLLALVRDELRAAEEGRTELGAPLTAGHE